MICPYCDTEFEVPEGRRARIERTCDMPPPAKVAAWLWNEETNRPCIDEGPLHYCERGHAKAIPG